MFADCLKSFLFVAILSTPLTAGPKIEFNTKSFQCGTVFEGKTEKINANFIVKNSGNAVLKLENVKPGCGCTVVKYDSTVAPGKSARIESTVNIKGYRSGPITKYITVTSNAENEPSVRLTIEATIAAIIDISESYLSLDAAGASRTLVLASKKADLKVTGVAFKAADNSNGQAWKAEIPLTIKHTWTATDSTRQDGCHVYKLEVSAPPALDKSVTGSFTITTNHPDKQEIALQGAINK